MFQILVHNDKLSKRRCGCLTNKILKDLAFAAYGGYKCSCPKCPETNPAFMTMDHINDDGAKHRKELGGRGGSLLYRWLKKNNYPDGFRVLCMNCNMFRSVNAASVHT